MTAAVGRVDLQRHGRPGKNRPAGIPQPQKGRGLLAALVFQQLAHQLGAGVFLFFVAGQQAGRLDVNQPGGHLQKFTGDLHLVFPQGADVGHVLLQQITDIDIINTDLMLGEQRQDEIQRPLIFIDLKGEFFHFSRSLSQKSCNQIEEIIYHAAQEGKRAIQPPQHEDDEHTVDDVLLVLHHLVVKAGGQYGG